MKHMAKMGKIVIKKWGFRGKKQKFEVGKNMNRQQTRKAKWCKMQVVDLKIDKYQDMKG